jgi:serine/threonine-protein kinase
VLLARALIDAGDVGAGVALLRRAAGAHPGDALVHYELGLQLANLRPPQREEAIRALSIARALQPELAGHELAHALEQSGRNAEAEAVWRDLIRRRPNNGRHLCCCAFHLRHYSHAAGAGRILEHAVTVRRAEIRLRPDDAIAYNGLGMALQQQGKLDEAAAAYREAIRLLPDYAEAHCNLADILRRQGRYAEALQEGRRGHELGSRRPGWHYPSAEWVAQYEKWAKLADRLPAVLKGEAAPRDNAECLGFAEMASETQHYAAAVRLWAEGFQANPQFADSRRYPQHRYDAACAAALAAAGQGKGDLPADEAAKAKLRAQALEWLRAELAAWARHLDSNPKARPVVVQSLQHWKVDSDLVGVRDAKALEARPEPERSAWRALWAEVDRRLQQEPGKP